MKKLRKFIKIRTGGVKIWKCESHPFMFGNKPYYRAVYKRDGDYITDAISIDELWFNILKRYKKYGKYFATKRKRKLKTFSKCRKIWHTKK